MGAAIGFLTMVIAFIVFAINVPAIGVPLILLIVGWFIFAVNA